jgi:hypothetical protein
MQGDGAVTVQVGRIGFADRATHEPSPSVSAFGGCPIAREPRWWPAEYEAHAQAILAAREGDLPRAAYWSRRLTNICAAKRRWQSRNNVVSMEGVPV